MFEWVVGIALVIIIILLFLIFASASGSGSDVDERTFIKQTDKIIDELERVRSRIHSIREPSFLDIEFKLGQIVSNTDRI